MIRFRTLAAVLPALALAAAQAAAQQRSVGYEIAFRNAVRYEPLGNMISLRLDWYVW